MTKPPRDTVSAAIDELRSYLISRQYADEDAAVDLDDTHPLLTVGALRTILSALATRSPSREYVLVPREPTQEMIRSAEKTDVFCDDARTVWSVMIAAAPKEAK